MDGADHMASTVQSVIPGIPAPFEPVSRSDSSGATALGNQDLSKDLFLKLMVAQLRNQNPLNPVDGVDFLAQLSQISGVEQMIEMRKELEGIHSILSSLSGQSR